MACAGEPAELGTHILRSAALAGVLNAVLDEHVNLVNAPARAAERGLTIEETTRPRERGIADVVEVAVAPAGDGKRGIFRAGNRALRDNAARCCRINGIAVESALEGTLLILRNRDVPGVIGQIGTLLGEQGVNIATFALGRREAVLWAPMRWRIVRTRWRGRRRGLAAAACNSQRDGGAIDSPACGGCGSAIFGRLTGPTARRRERIATNASKFKNGSG